MKTGNKMQVQSRVSGKALQQGFTLLELLVSLIVVGLLAAMGAYFYLDQDGVKGQALHAEVAQVQKAFERAKLDANCYPLLPEALVDKSKGTTSSCGIDISSTLKGPYLKSVSFDAASAMKVPSASATAVMTVTSQTVSGKTTYYLSVSDVPEGIGSSFVSACNRGATTSTPCAQGTVTGGRAPITMILG